MAQAADIKDPQGFINQISSYLGRPSFDEDFKCGDKSTVSGGARVAAVKVQSLEMTQEIVCDGSEKLLRTKILSSSGAALEHVPGYDQEMAGNIFENIDDADLVLDRDAYESDPKEFMFKMLEYVGENEIEIKSVKLDRVEGPNDQKINALVVKAEITINEYEVPGMFKKMSVKVYISKDLPAVSRVFKTEISTGKVLIMNTAGAKLEVTSVRRGN